MDSESRLRMAYAILVLAGTSAEMTRETVRVSRESSLEEDLQALVPELGPILLVCDGGGYPHLPETAERGSTYFFESIFEDWSRMDARRDVLVINAQDRLGSILDFTDMNDTLAFSKVADDTMRAGNTVFHGYDRYPPPVHSTHQKQVFTRQKFFRRTGRRNA